MVYNILNSYTYIYDYIYIHAYVILCVCFFSKLDIYIYIHIFMDLIYQIISQSITKVCTMQYHIVMHFHCLDVKECETETCMVD